MKTVCQKPLICRQGTGPKYGRHGEGSPTFTSIQELSLVVRTGDRRPTQLSKVQGCSEQYALQVHWDVLSLHHQGALAQNQNLKNTAECLLYQYHRLCIRKGRWSILNLLPFMSKVDFYWKMKFSLLLLLYYMSKVDFYWILLETKTKMDYFHSNSKVRGQKHLKIL